MVQRSRFQTGFGLIELMVAVALGLVISAGLTALFFQATRNQGQDERYARMLEHGRYALESIADDVKMVDFWGELLDPASITTTLAPGEDCDIDLFSAADAIRYNNNHAGMISTQFAVAADACPALTGTIKAGTDVLAFKRVSDLPMTAGQIDGPVYLRTNSISGSFIDDAGSTPLPVSFQDWLYVPRIYYIRDDAIPRLCRIDINGTGLGAVPDDGCLAEGIEDLHIEFGIDTDNDGTANRYKSNPTLGDMENVVTARIYVLARGAEADVNYTNTKTYTLGDVVIAPSNDNFYRRVLSTTVSLRNPASFISLR